MLHSIGQRFDQLGRRHPRLMLAFTMFSALVVTMILLVYSEGQAILYEAF